MSASAIHLPPGAAFDPSARGARNLTAAWSRHWQAEPDARQIHDPERGWITRGELAVETERRAGRLAAQGLRAGDRVLLSAASSFELVATHVAALRMGLAVLPTNTAYGPRELAHVIEDARPAAAIVDAADKAEAIAEIAPSLLRLSPELAVAEGPTPPLDEAAPEVPDRKSVV